MDCVPGILQFVQLHADGNVEQYFALQKDSQMHTWHFSSATYHEFGCPQILEFLELKGKYLDEIIIRRFVTGNRLLPLIGSTERKRLYR